MKLKDFPDKCAFCQKTIPQIYGRKGSGYARVCAAGAFSFYGYKYEENGECCFIPYELWTLPIPASGKTIRKFLKKLKNDVRNCTAIHIYR